jgi:hypothetical protein
MNPETATVENELLEHLVITHAATGNRLLKEPKNGVHAFTLYNFYALTATNQMTNIIRATDAYCMKGLGWGRDKFHAAKNILLDLRVVETIQRKNEKGRIIGNYVKIHYIKKSSVLENHPVDAPPSGFRLSNALDINNNALENNSTNVLGDSGKMPSCPLLKDSPLKDRYPYGHTECVQYLTSEETDRGRRFINPAKQYQAIHRILRAGYGFDVMDRTIPTVEKKYGKGMWDFTTLANWIEKGAGHAK